MSDPDTPPEDNRSPSDAPEGTTDYGYTEKLEEPSEKQLEDEAEIEKKEAKEEAEKEFDKQMNEQGEKDYEDRKRMDQEEIEHDEEIAKKEEAEYDTAMEKEQREEPAAEAEPTDENSHLFAVRTTGGQEKIVMRMLEARLKMGTVDLQSVLLLDDLKGYVVVESRDVSSMFNAIQGLRHVRGQLRGELG